MSWNGSGEEKMEKRGRGGERGTRNSAVHSEVTSASLAKRGLVAGMIVVTAGVGVVLWMFGRSDETTAADRQEKAPELIKSVGSAKVTEPAPAANRVERQRPPQRVGELRDGYRLWPDGKLTKVVGVTTSRVAKVTLAEKTFPNYSDVAIAELLTMESGESMIGDSKDYYRRFDKVFAKSLETPIEIAEDDSDEVKDLKQSVIEVRNDLKARMDAGEDIREVMRQTRDQMRELSLYRKELEDQVVRLASEGDGFTQKDLDDLVGAANTMLKDRGAKPLVLRGSLSYKIRRGIIKNANKAKGETK